MARGAEGRGKRAPVQPLCSHRHCSKAPGPLGDQMRLFFPSPGSSGVSPRPRTAAVTVAFLQQERGRNFSSVQQWHQQCAPPTSQRRREEGSRFPWRSIAGKPGGSVSRRTLPSAASPRTHRSLQSPWAPGLSSLSLQNHRWRQKEIARVEANPENPRRPGEALHRAQGPGPLSGWAQRCHTWVARC